MAPSSRPRTTDPWNTFAFVSVFLAALVVAANAYVLAEGRQGDPQDFVLALSGEAEPATQGDQLMVARGDIPAGDPSSTSDAATGDTAPPDEPGESARLAQPTPVTAGTPDDEAATPPASSANPEADDPGELPASTPAPEPTIVPSAPEARAAGNDAAPATVAPAATPTAAAPADGGRVEGLTIWSGGDSMSYFMTVALFEAAEARGVIPVSPANYVVSSGLLPGGPYDWFPRIEADMAQFDPDIAVFMVGANDANGAAADPEGYARLVGEAMDLFAGRRVYWVGQPPMGREDLQASIPVVNRIFAEEAAKRDFVTYVETWSIMAEADGSMLWYDDADQLLRAETDGIHVTPTGGARMAGPVIQAVLP